MLPRILRAKRAPDDSDLLPNTSSPTLTPLGPANAAQKQREKSRELRFPIPDGFSCSEKSARLPRQAEVDHFFQLLSFGAGTLTNQNSDSLNSGKTEAKGYCPICPPCRGAGPYGRMGSCLLSVPNQLRESPVHNSHSPTLFFLPWKEFSRSQLPPLRGALQELQLQHPRGGQRFGTEPLCRGCCAGLHAHKD